METLRNHTFCITGTLRKVRARVVNDIEAAGGRWTRDVSSRTQFLVVGILAGDRDTAKLRRAQESGVCIIDETRLYELIANGFTNQANN